MASPADLSKLLRDRGGFEAVDVQEGKTQIRLEGRVPPNASSHWVLVVHHLLVLMEQKDWKVDISKHFFVRQLKSGAKMFYAWRLIFQSPDVAKHLDDILLSIGSSPRPARVELQEYPLPGAGAHRNEFQNGKGAGSVDRVPLGPMAAAAAMTQRVRNQ